MSDPLITDRMKRRIVFMGSPDFALPCLKRLAATHDVRAVYTQPAKKSGRGMKPTPVPVAAHAMATGLPLFTPDALTSEAVLSQLASHEADVFVVVAYRLLLPPRGLAMPRFGCLNGHASLLPRWRGAAPIQRAIEAGDPETGISAMLMEKGLDTGPVVATLRTAISGDDTAGSLHDRLAGLTADCLGTVVDDLPASLAKPQPQPETGISYARKISSAEAKIDWRRTASELDHHIRAFSPYPGAWCHGPKGRLRILSARPVPILANDAAAAGGFMGADNDGMPLVRCGDGALALAMLQPAGKKPMTGAAFLNGVTLAYGASFSVEGEGTAA